LNQKSSIITASNQETIINRLFIANQRYNNLSIALSTLEAYISDNTTNTLLNQDGGEQLVQILNSIKHDTQFTETFVNSDGSLSYANLLTGNICNTLDAKMMLYCQSIASQSGEQGILAMGQWMAQTLGDFKKEYDFSNKSKEAQMECMALETHTEVVDLHFDVQSVAYFNLITAIKSDFDSMVVSQGTKSMYYSTLCMTALAIVSAVFMRKLYQMIKLRYNNFKNMLKMFPIDLILANTYLKYFIVKTGSQLTISMLRTSSVSEE